MRWAMAATAGSGVAWRIHRVHKIKELERRVGDS